MIEAASRGWRPYVLLLLLCLGLYVPGLAALPVMDRDEARFAQATRQMLESGDYLRIRFQDEARNKKPAAIYWLQAASVAAFSDAKSDAIWPYRLPSLLGATGAVLLAFAFGARLVGPAGGAVGCGAACILAARSRSRRISPRPTRRCSSLALPRRAHSERSIARRGAAASHRAGRSSSGRRRARQSWSRGRSRRRSRSLPRQRSRSPIAMGAGCAA